MNAFDLKDHELTVAQVHHNLPVGALYEHAIRYEKDASIADNGALVAYSGSKTGRSPKDKRVVKNSASQKDVWWGSVNVPMEPTAFAINRERAKDRIASKRLLPVGLGLWLRKPYVASKRSVTRRWMQI